MIKVAHTVFDKGGKVSLEVILEPGPLHVDVLVN